MLNLIVMVSGGGTNLQAIIDSIESGYNKNAKIVKVISNNKNAYALTRAKEHGIEAEALSPKDFENREDYNKALLELVDRTFDEAENKDADKAAKAVERPEAGMNQSGAEGSIVEKPGRLIVLAGFLVVIPPAMAEKYANRIINIHPSLIPSFCGKGFYGLHVHEAALERGVKVTGATVHFVDAGTDTGPIILQKAVEVRDGDTPEVLQKRVMEEAEWKILPEAIRLISEDRVEVKSHRTILTD